MNWATEKVVGSYCDCIFNFWDPIILFLLHWLMSTYLSEYLKIPIYSYIQHFHCSNKYLFLCMCVCVCVTACHVCVVALRDQKRVYNQSCGAGVIGCWELPRVSVRNRIQSFRRIRITLNCGVVTPASLLIKTTIIAKQQHSPSCCLAVLSYVSIMTCDLSPVHRLIGWRFSLVESFALTLNYILFLLLLPLEFSIYSEY